MTATYSIQNSTIRILEACLAMQDHGDMRIYEQVISISELEWWKARGMSATGKFLKSVAGGGEEIATSEDFRYCGSFCSFSTSAAF